MDETENLRAVQRQIELAQGNDTSPKRVSFESVLDRVRTAPVTSDAELARRAVAERDRDRQDALRRLRIAVGSRLAACTFENFTISTEYQRHVVATLREWSTTFTIRQENGEGIVLYGPVGTGKDHLALAAVVSAMIASRYVVRTRWINGRELFGMIRDRISDEEPEGPFMRQLTEPHILIISDPLPPVGDLTQHQADMLYRVCECRYAAKRITVATLNVATDDEADRRLGAATWDRLCHGAWKIACEWASYRKPVRDVRPQR